MNKEYGKNDCSIIENEEIDSFGSEANSPTMKGMKSKNQVQPYYKKNTIDTKNSQGVIDFDEDNEAKEITKPINLHKNLKNKN